MALGVGVGKMRSERRLKPSFGEAPGESGDPGLRGLRGLGSSRGECGAAAALDSGGHNLRNCLPNVTSRWRMEEASKLTGLGYSKPA
mmetsp:Transcript_18393/g.42961  ORF Transcript_18393/g.42961 Transcript_18393/m.42961 type:complete len:87 (-) Transcript_18393:5082-5342(-)